MRKNETTDRGAKRTRGVFTHGRQFLKGFFYVRLAKFFSLPYRMDLQRLFIDSLLLTFHKLFHSYAVRWLSIVSKGEEVAGLAWPSRPVTYWL